MALKVADLYAALTVDDRGFDRGVQTAVQGGERRLDRLVDASREIAQEMGREIGRAEGDFDRAGVKLAEAAGDGLSRLERAGREAAAGAADAVAASSAEMGSAGRRAGDAAGQGVEAGVRGAGRQAGDQIGAELRASDVPAAGRQVGEEAGEGIKGGLNDAMGSLGDSIDLGPLSDALTNPGTAMGAALGAAFMAGLNDHLQREAGEDIIAARLAATPGEAQQMGRVAGRLWADAWGESRDDVNAAIDAVYSTLEESREGEAALERLTGKALQFSAVMGDDGDLQRAVGNVGIMIREGLVDTAEEGFDILTAALQRVPAASRDELMEAATEYSQFFAGLGMDGEAMFGILSDAADRGRYAVDKAGDSVKEFRIRATDMSKATIEAYDEMGLSAEEMTNRLLAGGPEAAAAFREIVDAIIAIPDPARRANTAIALFGTPFEDIAGDGAKVDEVLRSLATGSLPDVEGSLERTGSAFENTATDIEMVKRAAMDLLSWWSSQRIEGSAAWLRGDWVGGLTSDIGNLAGIPGDVATGVGGWIADKMFGDEGEVERRGRGLGEAVGRAGRAARESGDDAREGGKGHDANRQAIDRSTLSAEELEEVYKQLGDALKSYDARVEGLTSRLGLGAAAAEGFRDAIERSTSLDDQAGSASALGQTIWGLNDALEALPSKGVDMLDLALGKVAEDADAGVRALVSFGDQAGAVLSDLIEGGAGPDTVRAWADQIRARLVEALKAAGIRDPAVIEQYLGLAGLQAGQIEIALTVAMQEQERAKFEAILNVMQATATQLSPEVQPHLTTAILEGDFLRANAILEAQQAALDRDPMRVQAALGDYPDLAPLLEALQAEATASPTVVPVTANTSKAWDEVGLWRLVQSREPVTIPVQANITSAQQALDDFGRRLGWGTNPMPGGGGSRSTPPSSYEVPRRHTGGIVPGPHGAEVDIRALGGETVRTPNQERELQRALAEPAPVRFDLPGVMAGLDADVHAAVTGGGRTPALVGAGASDRAVVDQLQRTTAELGSKLDRLQAMADRGDTFHVTEASPRETAREIAAQRRNRLFLNTGTS